uniref:Uncharacterized protein n=1 Tax=Arundo donax TaxID=35708 RepID=A0A0A9B3T3_ARUDO
MNCWFTVLSCLHALHFMPSGWTLELYKFSNPILRQSYYWITTRIH